MEEMGISPESLAARLSFQTAGSNGKQRVGNLLLGTPWAAHLCSLVVRLLAAFGVASPGSHLLDPFQRVLQLGSVGFPGEAGEFPFDLEVAALLHDHQLAVADFER